MNISNLLRMKAKNLKGFIGLCFILCFTKIYAQDWNVINSGFKYNYTHNQEKHISNTVWVDTTKTLNGDTIFYFNRIVIDCDTCTPLNGLNLAEYDVPQFLQKEACKNDSIYHFRSPGSFVIKPQSKLSENWLYDSINNIRATVIEINSIVLFGINDSVKKISLSNGNSIEISKSFGIIYFTLPNDTFTLVGIDQLYGESVPAFKEFFSFAKGDLFEFHEIPAKNPDSVLGSLHINKILITGCNVHGDTLEYDLQVKHYERSAPLPEYLWYSPNWASSSEYISTWRFINSPDHPANSFNDQLLRIVNSIRGYNTSECNPFPLTKSYFDLDTNEVFTKIVGSFEKNNWFVPTDSKNHLLKREYATACDCDVIAYRYKPGLGEVYCEASGFEMYYLNELYAFRKGNDTTGIFTPDDKMVVRIDESKEEKIIIFPNPAHDYIKIVLPGSIIPDNITLIGMDGRVIKNMSNTDILQVNNIQKGIYIIKVEYKSNVTFIKVLISPVQEY
jgi:hypothetical protein